MLKHQQNTLRIIVRHGPHLKHDALIDMHLLGGRILSDLSNMKFSFLLFFRGSQYTTDVFMEFF